MPTKGDDDGFFLDSQDGGLGILGASRMIGDRRAPLPFGYRLGVNAVTLRKHNQALLTMLYCSTDRRCRAGAPV